MLRKLLCLFGSHEIGDRFPFPSGQSDTHVEVCRHCHWCRNVGVPEREAPRAQRILCAFGWHEGDPVPHPSGQHWKAVTICRHCGHAEQVAMLGE